MRRLERPARGIPMPRWRQDAETGKLVPIDAAAAKIDGKLHIQGDIEPFVSPIDGAVISDRKQYREHMKKHGVVPASEFSPEFLERKAEERARIYNGEHTPQQELARKRELYEVWTRAERQG